MTEPEPGEVDLSHIEWAVVGGESAAEDDRRESLCQREVFMLGCHFLKCSRRPIEAVCSRYARAKTHPYAIG